MPGSEPLLQRPLLQLEQIAVQLGGRDIVEGISLVVHAGERVALLGANGAGKSTLLRATCGIIPVSAGRVLLAGHPLDALTHRTRARRVALATQELQAGTGWSVRELVALGRGPWRGLGAATPRDAAVVDEALAAFDLTAFADRRVDRLSGGERRLVHLARTHAQATPLLLLDEPLAHLDLAYARTALDAINATLEARTGAAIAVLHEPSHALAWATRIVLLRDGAVLADVAPSELDGDLLSACYATPVLLLRDAQGHAIGVSRDAPRG